MYVYIYMCVCVCVCIYVCICTVLVHNKQSLFLYTTSIFLMESPVLCQVRKASHLVLKLLNGKYFLAPLFPFQSKHNLPHFS